LSGWWEFSDFALQARLEGRALAVMNFDELLRKLVALPDPEEETDKGPVILGMDFSEAALEDLKAIAMGEIPEEWSDEDISNAAVQACRAIAMRGEAGELPFFLKLSEYWGETFVGEMLSDEFTWVMSQMGGEVVPEALKALRDERTLEMDRLLVSEGLDELAEEGVEREVIYAAYADFLRELRPDRMLNGYLAGTLIEARPEDFRAEILGVYEANVVDVTVIGDLEQVEIELGIREERENEIDDLFELERKLLADYRKGELGEFPEKGEAVERAEYILRFYQEPGSIADAAALDGIYAAVICSPVMVRPTDLFKLPWKSTGASPKEGPDYANEEDAKRGLTALQDFYNTICDGINKLTYIPALPGHEEEGGEIQVFPMTWLIGVFMGAAYLEENYGENSYTRKISKLAKNGLESLKEDEGLSPEAAMDLMSPVMEALIVTHHKEKGQRRSLDPIEQVVREDTKVGRNDPCPCGSGKKYKKCCAN